MKYLLDTNSIIFALNTNIVLPGDKYQISIITEMELLSYPKLNIDEERIIRKLLSNFEIINIDNSIKEKTIEIRKKYKMKLPDSIIVASALEQRATLITSDKQLFRVDEIKVITIKDLL